MTMPFTCSNHHPTKLPPFFSFGSARSGVHSDPSGAGVALNSTELQTEAAKPSSQFEPPLPFKKDQANITQRKTWYPGGFARFHFIQPTSGKIL